MNCGIAKSRRMIKEGQLPNMAKIILVEFNFHRPYSYVYFFALTFLMLSAYCELGPCSQYRRVILCAKQRKLELKAQKSILFAAALI
jgi:hypothetical protein